MRCLLLIVFFCITLCGNAQTVVCSAINTSGYNTENESAYVERLENTIQYGCGAPHGKQILFKNNHRTRTIKGFVVKKWQYNNGYENREVCELHYFELKPNEQSVSMGCNYITQTQPCEFRAYGKFLD